MSAPPMMFSGTTENPGVSVGIRKIEMPLWRGASGSVRVASHT